jgi:hypothetical protein
MTTKETSDMHKAIFTIKFWLYVWVSLILVSWLYCKLAGVPFYLMGRC